MNRLFKLGCEICGGYVLTLDFQKQYFSHNKIGIDDTNIITRIQDGHIDLACYPLFKNIFASPSQKTGGVIVRSSPIDEDGKNKSYAGIFESIVNVKRFEDMLIAIKKVWSSRFSILAKKYEYTNNMASMPVLEGVPTT